MSGVMFFLAGVALASYLRALHRYERPRAAVLAVLGLLCLLIGFATN